MNPFLESILQLSIEIVSKSAVIQKKVRHETKDTNQIQNEQK